MEFYNNYIKKNWWFIALASIAILLMIASFILPPTGSIDNSVILAVGELFAFGALGTLIKAIDEGKTASVRKGDTELTIGNKED